MVVLIGILLVGLAVALRAIRARERRIGWALLGFCIVYLLALAGLVTGVAGAAPPTRRTSVTAGDGENALTFDAPPAGLALVIRRAAGAAAPASCATGAPVSTAGAGTGSGRRRGARERHRLPLPRLPERCGRHVVRRHRARRHRRRASTPRRRGPCGGSRSRALGGRVVLGWRNPADRDFGTALVVRKFGSQPTSPSDGKVVYRGDRPSLLDYPFSLRSVNYAVFALDEDDNAAAAVRASLPRFDPPLRTPFDRSVIRQNRPRFTWKKKTGADGYNVQVYDAKRCCNPRGAFVNAFPKTASPARAAHPHARHLRLVRLRPPPAGQRAQLLRRAEPDRLAVHGPLAAAASNAARSSAENSTNRTSSRRARPRPRASPRPRSAPPRRSDSRRCRSRWPETRSSGS